MEVGPHGWRLKRRGKTVLISTEIALVQHLVGMDKCALGKAMQITVQVKMSNKKYYIKNIKY